MEQHINFKSISANLDPVNRPSAEKLAKILSFSPMNFSLKFLLS